MVAGMLMPRDRLRAIYEILFRDGVMVAKNDERPQCHHAEVPGVTNLQVSKAMGSLKSRGYVRETFAWKHCYWYLTNEGIVYLRQYLHLPPEIVPASLQRVRRPIAPLGLPRRMAGANNVQTVHGPISYVPKPQADVERQEYRRREETAPPKGQDTSFKTHVLQNSCQEGGWQKWAERDDQASSKRGTSSEKWGTKESYREERVGYEPRGPSGAASSDSWTEETMFRRIQGLRREEVSRRHIVTENAAVLTAPASVFSSYEKEKNGAKEEKLESSSALSWSDLMSLPQNAAKRSKGDQKFEESRTVRTERSVEVHVVSSVESSHKTLEVSVHQEGVKLEVNGKTPGQRKVLVQESKQEKNQGQVINLKEEETVKASSVSTTSSDRRNIEAAQEVKQRRRDNTSADRYLEVVSQSHVLPASKSAAEQQSEMLQSKKQEEEETSVTAGPITEPPKIETKIDGTKGQKKKGQEKSRANLATETKKTQKPSDSTSAGVKSESNGGAIPEGTPKSEASKTKAGKSKKEDKTSGVAAEGPSELAGAKEDNLETKSQSQHEGPGQVTSTAIQAKIEQVSPEKDKKGSKGKGKKAKKEAIESPKSEAQIIATHLPKNEANSDLITQNELQNKTQQKSKDYQENDSKLLSTMVQNIKETVTITQKPPKSKEELQTVMETVTITQKPPKSKEELQTVQERVTITQKPAESKEESKTVQETVAITQKPPKSKEELQTVTETVTITQKPLKSKEELQTVQERVTITQKPPESKEELQTVQETVTITQKPPESKEELQTVTETVAIAQKPLESKEELQTVQETVAITQKSSESKKETKTVQKTVTITQEPPESTEELQTVQEKVTVTQKPPESKKESKTVQKTVTITQKPPESKEELQTVTETVAIIQKPPESEEELQTVPVTITPTSSESKKETKTIQKTVTITQKPPESKEELQTVQETVTITQKPPESKKESKTVQKTVTITQKPPESQEESKIVQEMVTITQKPPKSKEELQTVKKTVSITQKPSQSKVEELQTVKETATVTQKPLQSKEEVMTVKETVNIIQSSVESKVGNHQTSSRTVTFSSESKVKEVSVVTSTQRPPGAKIEALQTVSETIILTHSAPEVKAEKEEAEPLELEASPLPAEDPESSPEEDERDRVQKKTFTKWVNKHLIKHWRAEAQRHVNDLYEDLRDGHNLISLLEVLSGETLPRERDVIRNLRLPREKGRMRFHKLQNVQIALDFLKLRQVKLVNIRNDDIADGNPKLTLGLIWTIILHFQISDIQVSGQSEDMTAKEKLLLWSQRMTEGYQGLRCDNFTGSWRDGRLFNAIIHRHKPMLIDMNRVYRQTNIENLDQAFNVAERELGVTRLLDPEDVDVPQPDEKSIITYVSSLYDAMPRVPDVQDGVRANELELRWHEYYERVTMLLQWIRHYTVIFEEKRFPASYEEIEILWRQFLKFKETDLPNKEADKNQSKLQYQSLEGAVKSGQLKVTPGYHPLDVEKEWGKLHVSILEREKLLRFELDRLERLQRIVSKLQMESGLCEEQLNQADALLQTNIRLLNAGKPMQRAGDIERDLDKADAMIRVLFNDVQALKDGRHPQGEQMYRRVYRLHERLVAIRTEYNLRIKSGAQQVVTQVTHVTQQSVRSDMDEVTLRYLQDLLGWVEENQKRINTAEWGSDLPSVESQLGSHRGLHQSINEFRSKIERARTDEAQMSGSRGSFQEYLGKLDLQYAKLLNSSKARLRHLESLHAFVAAATKELMWLNDKEEEEVNFDWSDRNTNMTSKKDNYSGLMRELELKENKIKEIQSSGDRLLREDHPGRSTVEAFQAALQTQWSWMLQLCCCIEAHLKENTAYFQFFTDVKESEEHLKKIQDNMRRKYTCDRSNTVTRLEDLLQDSLDEKEQLTEYKGQISGLAKRAKSIVQLKPRNPANAPKGQQPIQAVCDYKQMEITIHKGDECLLVNNSQPYKWKVLNSSGNDAVVPSVCFIVPPPNKEAMDAVSRLESSHQNLLTLWHRLHIDLKSLLSYQYLLRDIQIIQSWTLVTFRSMTSEEYKLILRNLELHYQDFLRDSQDSQNFHPDDRMNIEREYNSCNQKYETLLRSLERGEQDESTCKNYISQLKNIQLQLEGCEARTVSKIRSPLDRDPVRECSQRIGDQQQIHFELETIQKNLDKVSEKTRKILAQPDLGAAAPVLRTEHDITLQKMDQVHSLSSIYLEKLKTINLVIRNTHGAEEVVKTYEDQLKDVHTVPADLKELENSKIDLKRMRGQVEGHQPLFSGLDSDLIKAREVSEKMLRSHNERDVDLDRYREKVQQLLERWQAIVLQIDLRQRELEQLGKQLRYYRESYEWLIRWIQDAKQRQERIQSVPITDSKTVREQLQEEKKLLEESEKNRVKVDECQKFAKQYIDAIKDFELQLVTYKAQVEPVASPVKKPKVQSTSENIIQEYVDLRTKYSELTTLTSQYIKFITETLRRLEEEEMEVAQREQLRQETQTLQSTFLSEKQILIQKEKYIEEEKAKLEKLFQQEVNKAQNLKAEKERKLQQLEEEKRLLQISMDDAVKRQFNAEDMVRQKQEELQLLDKRRLEQERLLEEENRKLRERLEQLEQEHRIALERTKEIVIHKETIITQTRAVSNGRDSVDGSIENGEQENAFDGLRQKVSANKLYEAGILTKEMLDKLSNKQVSVDEVSQREDIKKYLQGKSSIAGLLLKPSNEKISIYNAMKKKLLTPGTALILLEAQAASGYIIDPVRNKKLTVSEAVKENVIGPEIHNKMLSAERAITGYKDPYTGEKISLFQAMNKDLIVKDHGIRLLEAQIATGGIVDPVNSHRLPLDVAYQRGYFDEEMSQILSDPSDDTKGFFDPNTQENLTYLQLMEKCIIDPETKLCLLPLTDKAAKGELVYTDSEAKDVFKKATVSVPFGKFQGKSVTIWEIINSEYFTEEQRRELLRQYKTGKITVEKIIKIIITVVEENEKKNQMCFDGLRGPVPAAELVDSKIIDNDLFNQLHQGKKSVKEVCEVDAVKRYLTGSTAIAGVRVEKSGQKLSFYDAISKNLLKPATALNLLEAQAGTGFIMEPVNGELLPVDEAVKAGIVGPEYHEKLLSAEKAVTGYKDPYTGQALSLFQALKKGLIPKDSGIRLLGAQLATGGVIDPVNSHRLPLEIAYKRGHLDEETTKILSEPVDENTGYYDPNSQENLSYAQLQKKCKVDKKTGYFLLPLSEQAIQSQLEEVYNDSQAKEAFDKATVEVPIGRFKGRIITLWELIHSEYFTEEQRRELLRQYKTGKVTIEKIIKIMITIVEETETKRQQRLTFTGLRAPVPANELLEANIIDKTQYEQLKEGKKSVKEISETESVKRYLQGSDCIAGIYIEENKMKMNIYQAMKRNMLRPGTALVLLEAQASTGFIIDPVKNQKFYVNEAVKAGVVGPELHEKLLSAEKAVTGYKDPYSGNTISVFEAMQKGLILREHGIRILEAQIATGGIIDPVHSHRVPVEVAYKRGYFDEAMNKILSDPTDDTRGFFDPNTHENLTYLQLKERCIKDPETGLTLLPLKKTEKPAASAETSKVYNEAETKKVFEETTVDIPSGSMAGSSMTIWELMHSDLLPKEERDRLMAEFQAGRLTKERMIIIIIEIIEKTEIIRQQELYSYDFVRRRITAEDMYESRLITLEMYNMLKQGTKTIQEIIQIETVWRYLYGTGCVAGLQMPASKETISVYQAMKKGLITLDVAYQLLDAQVATGFLTDPVKNELLTVDEAVRKGVVGPEIHDRLLSAERAVTGYRDPYTEQMISIFQAMKKDLIPSDQALRLLDAQLATGGVIDPRFGFHIPNEIAYAQGYLNKETLDMLSEPSEVRSYVDPSTDEKLSYSQLLKRCRRDEKSNLLLMPLADKRKLTFKGLRKEISMEELIRSNIMDAVTAQQLQDGLTSIEEVSRNLQKYLEGTSCIAGVYVEATKERYSIYQAMKKGMIRPGTAFELLEAQAATGYVIDPIKCLKLAVEDAVRMGIVGPEFKDKLLSAERAVTGYKDPYSGKLISLFQAMKKGLILKDHGIRLLEAQIATGGIIDPEESHRLPVETAYKRGLFDEEMNEILLDPSDDTKGFFDPNTEENLTYLQLMERCITDPDTNLCLLPLKEKKRERKTSSKSSVRKRRVVIVDPETGKEMSVYEAYRKGLIDQQTYMELSEQECEWEEVTISSSDGVVKSIITDRRSGRQYDIDDALSKGLIDQSSLDQYRSGTLSITEFADMLSGNMSGFRSRSSSVGSSSSYTASPGGRTQLSSWSDPSEETGPIAGIVDTDTLEKVSVTEAMHRNLVDNITGQRLLEAQACTGGIIDPITGEKFSVADAVNKGLVDKIMVDRINLAQKAYNGFEDPRTKTKMSAAQALKKGWLYYEAGQRFLEVQYLTGGLIEPEVPGRVGLEEALRKGTIDSRTAQKLRDVNTYSKYLTCPKTKLKISYKEAMEKSMVEDGTGLRLLEASSQSSKGYYSPYNASGPGSASGSRSGSRTGSRSGSRRGSIDGTGNSSFTMNFSSSSYTSSSYGRRYTSGPQEAPFDAAELASALLKLHVSCSQESRRGFNVLVPLVPGLV
ncbi:plectin isoform X5 [Hyla sarda]|uniref:plectin isoform X5 n=1 Tax=Hyla sarda TaxID=327740 RepID=UPI0024C3B207|nr:plectin isoform X5 [Hyla sarda]